MVRTRPSLPSGHGELLLRPAYDLWLSLIERNRTSAQAWDFAVAGIHARDLRSLAREELALLAAEFSERLGVQVAPPKGSEEPVVMTGHQPELFHPGIWVKDFLLQQIGTRAGATAIDIVVDTDGFDTVTLVSPCLTPEVKRCRQYLAVGAEGTCYACAPAPSSRELEQFCEAGDAQLATLPAPSIRRHFADFSQALRSAESDAENLAELVTFARRRYEASAGTDYLELPVTSLVRSRAYAAFVVDIAFNASRFAEAYNAELQAFRTFSKTRSKAQPFPDLEIEDGRVELPLWSVDAGSRETLWVSPASGNLQLWAGENPLVSLPTDPEAAIAVLLAAPSFIAPKALALTLFARLFCCDLFIHGVGGGRYDTVTDGVCRRYFGVEPPAFVVASLTMYLPLGAHIVTEDEVSIARERVNRLGHNPNQLLEEVEFDSHAERERAYGLAAEKDRLVSEISLPDADKKALGQRIRAVNAELAGLLEPLRQEWEGHLASLESQRAASEVFSDRGYPFCFWSPSEIADKVW